MEDRRREIPEQPRPGKGPKLDTNDSTVTDDGVECFFESESVISSRRRFLREKNTNETVEERSNVGAPSPSVSSGRTMEQIDDSDDYCFICLDGGEEIMVCCDICPKVFHISCHLPPIKVISGEHETWRCNYDSSKESIEEEISNFEVVENSDRCPLVEDSNKRQYLLACKFLMECYKIPEIPTIRWPTGYDEKFKKLPYHLKYIKDRLCFSKPSPFASIEEMLLAVKQVFQQTVCYYDKEKQDEVHMHAGNGFKKFLEIVEVYYPAYKHLYADKIQ